MSIKSIFAVDHWGNMGFRGSLPWPHNSQDLKFFKEKTQGDIVVMGRRTWDDPKMPKPLPDRTAYVVTHRHIGMKGVHTLQGDIRARLRALQAEYPTRDIWVIGGPELLMTARDLTEIAHITHFRGQYRADVSIDMRRYLQTFQATGCKPSEDHSCHWMSYKNIDVFQLP